MAAAMAGSALVTTIHDCRHFGGISYCNLDYKEQTRCVGWTDAREGKRNDQARKDIQRNEGGLRTMVGLRVSAWRHSLGR